MNHTQRSIVIVLAGVLCAFGSRSTHATSFTLAPDAVNGMAAIVPTDNFPNYFSQYAAVPQGSVIQTATSTFNAALVAALGPDPLGYDIISATLTIGGFTSLPASGSAYLLTTTFDPATVTWNMRDATHTWTTGAFSSADYSTLVSTGSISVMANTESFSGLAAQVQSWLNGSTNDGLAFPAGGGAFTGNGTATAVWALNAIGNVPEPGSLAMLAFGGVGLFVAARHRRSVKTLGSQLIVTMTCLGLSLLASSALATTINVDFNTIGGTSGTYSGLGAAGPTGTFWNGVNTSAQLTPAASLTSSALTASDGITVTPVTVSLGAFSSLDTALTGTGESVLAPALLNDLVYQAGTSTFAFNNVAPGHYNLYVYSLTGNESVAANLAYDTAFTIGAATQHVIQVPGVVPSSFISGANYTEFLGISPVSGTISGTWTFVSGNGANAILDGFQLVTVPEPTSLVLSGLGAIGLLVAARRHRKS